MERPKLPGVWSADANINAGKARLGTETHASLELDDRPGGGGVVCRHLGAAESAGRAGPLDPGRLRPHLHPVPRQRQSDQWPGADPGGGPPRPVADGGPDQPDPHLFDRRRQFRRPDHGRQDGPARDGRRLDRRRSEAEPAGDRQPGRARHQQRQRQPRHRRQRGDLQEPGQGSPAHRVHPRGEAPPARHPGQHRGAVWRVAGPSRAAGRGRLRRRPHPAVLERHPGRGRRRLDARQLPGREGRGEARAASTSAWC